MTTPVCPHCQIECRLTTGKEIYPHRPDLFEKKIWTCVGFGCDARVGCHDGTENPLGIPANRSLRLARMELHNKRLDPLWKTADACGLYSPEDEKARQKIRKAARNRVYAFLSHKLGIGRDECHTGMFTIERCRDAWRALNEVTYPQVRDWWQQEKSSGRSDRLYENGAAPLTKERAA